MRMSSRKNRRTEFGLESLETRVLMMGTPLTVSEVAWNGGLQLKIIGTSTADQ